MTRPSEGNASQEQALSEGQLAADEALRAVRLLSETLGPLHPIEPMDVQRSRRSIAAQHARRAAGTVIRLYEQAFVYRQPQVALATLDELVAAIEVQDDRYCSAMSDDLVIRIQMISRISGLDPVFANRQITQATEEAQEKHSFLLDGLMDSIVDLQKWLDEVLQELRLERNSKQVS